MARSNRTAEKIKNKINDRYSVLSGIADQLLIESETFRSNAERARSTTEIVAPIYSPPKVSEKGERQDPTLVVDPNILKETSDYYWYHILPEYRKRLGYIDPIGVDKVDLIDDDKVAALLALAVLWTGPIIHKSVDDDSQTAIRARQFQLRANVRLAAIIMWKFMHLDIETLPKFWPTLKSIFTRLALVTSGHGPTISPEIVDLIVLAATSIQFGITRTPPKHVHSRS